MLEQSRNTSLVVDMYEKVYVCGHDPPLSLEGAFQSMGDCCEVKSLQIIIDVAYPNKFAVYTMLVAIVVPVPNLSVVSICKGRDRHTTQLINSG